MDRYFNGTPPGQLGDVDHKDGDKDNNRADNLQWLSRQEHMEKTHGRVVEVDGVRYASVRNAARALSMGKHTVHRRLKRKVAGYVYVD